MQTSEKQTSSSTIHGLYHQPTQEMDTYFWSNYEVTGSNSSPEIGSQGINLSFQACNDPVFTLESSSAASGCVQYDSPSGVSISSNRSPYSMQGSQSCVSDPQQSSDNPYGSPVSGCSIAYSGDELKNKLRELEISLLGPDEDIGDSCVCCTKNGLQQFGGQHNWSQMMEMIPNLNLGKVLIACAQSISEGDTTSAAGFMEVLERMVSVSGDPIQRAGAYLLEGLRARLELSGSLIYRKLKCTEPTSSELMSYMHVLYQICPYWKFAYASANAVIGEAMQYEPRIHLIDFQIAQGSQWMLFIQSVAGRPAGPPCIRLTGVDDSQSAHARGGGLRIVGERLARFANQCGVPFEFHDATMCGSEVELSNLNIRPGEALAVNFPYVLHHMPDESVSIHNHRDRLLRLVKSLSPKVVTLVEQESNTNTSPFLQRFVETLDYYIAMFESIDAGQSKDNKQRVLAEQNCVARDIVNMISCEDAERVERHELLGKWRLRLNMAGFRQYPLSPYAAAAVKDVLKEYNQKYRVEGRDGALYLYWGARAMSTSSAWC
ncbi:hypothetical protein MLD38_039163 [Melastoma candidum]|uniref:Uncharacterized protein n=1 Tax=Melastoma candidum TaxID=119954 RepID=A0ACB9L1J1_9MYRT|nr:hypothetical protein MLD38_039163 [Melastoma candidum]